MGNDLETNLVMMRTSVGYDYSLLE